MFNAEGVDLRGKTIIVTGSNIGIGLETVCALAQYGARVIMACRDLNKAQLARQSILDRLKTQQDVQERVLVKKLDLASLSSVRQFADDVLQTESRLDVLINNAGMMGPGIRTLTEDGLEMTMASNHFGHFLLTNLLLPLLKQSAPSRIIVLSSMMHQFAPKFDVDNVNSEKSFKSTQIYGNTKLANVLFTRHLAKKLEGTGVIVNAVHPGFVDTNLSHSLPSWAKFMMKPFTFFLAKTPVHGAQTSIFLAASQSPEALVNGRYFADMKETDVSRNAKDDEVAARLWEVSEKLTGLKTD